MPLESWEHFFKPQVRSSGRTLSAKAKASQSRLSDTEVITYFKVSSAVKVVLKSDSVSSHSITADCSCPQSKKGQFCKYVWAALLVCSEKNPDFLDDKTELELKTHEKAESEPKTEAVRKREESQAAFRAKQANYRKEQYQKQKQRVKAWKKKKEAEPDAALYPVPVERALEFFSLNGFDLRESMTVEAVANAKKKLARVFHPDMGGSHEESIALNHHSEILMKFAKPNER